MKLQYYIIICLWVFAFACAGEAQNNKVINLGITRNLFDNVDLRDAKTAIQVWLNEMVKNAGMDDKTNVIILDDLKTARRAIDTNEIEVVFLPIIDYFELQPYCNLQPALIAVSDKNYAARFALVTPKKLNLHDMTELQDKHIIFQNTQKGCIAKLWFGMRLKQMGLPPKERFLKNIELVEKESQAVLKVFFGQADACIVHETVLLTMQELNPQLKTQLEMSELSPFYVEDIFCFNSSATDEHQRRVIEATLALINNPKERKVINFFQSSGVIEFKSEYILDIKALVDFHKKYISE